MKSGKVCRHGWTTFHSIQQLGNQPPIELRQCMHCHTTLAVPIPATPIAAVGVAASH